MINDDQYLSELEAKNESQKGEIDLLQSDLKETRKMAQMARDTSANLTVTLEELRLRYVPSPRTGEDSFIDRRSQESGRREEELFTISDHKDSKLTDKEKEALKRIMETNERLTRQRDHYKKLCDEHEDAEHEQEIERLCADSKLKSEKIKLLTKYCHILNDEIETPEHLKGFCDVIAVQQAVKHLLGRNQDFTEATCNDSNY
jgi:hypothetical protein